MSRRSSLYCVRRTRRPRDRRCSLPPGASALNGHGQQVQGKKPLIGHDKNTWSPKKHLIGHDKITWSPKKHADRRRSDQLGTRATTAATGGVRTGWSRS